MPTGQEKLQKWQSFYEPIVAKWKSYVAAIGGDVEQQIVETTIFGKTVYARFQFGLEYGFLVYGYVATAITTGQPVRVDTAVIVFDRLGNLYPIKEDGLGPAYGFGLHETDSVKNFHANQIAKVCEELFAKPEIG